LGFAVLKTCIRKIKQWTVNDNTILIALQVAMYIGIGAKMASGLVSPSAEQCCIIKLLVQEKMKL
jgi:hypothetical protein